MVGERSTWVRRALRSQLAEQASRLKRLPLGLQRLSLDLWLWLELARAPKFVVAQILFVGWCVLMHYLFAHARVPGHSQSTWTGPYIATCFVIVAVALLLHGVVYQSASLLFERGHVTPITRIPKRYWSVDTALLRESAKALWPLLALTAMLVANETGLQVPWFSRTLGTLRQQQLHWHALATAVVFFVHWLTLCANADYPIPHHLRSRVTMRRWLAKPFAAQAASYLWIGGAIYIVLVLGSMKELQRQGGRTLHPHTMMALHVILNAAVLAIGAVVCRLPSREPGRRSVRPTAPLLFAPVAIVGVNLLLAWVCMNPRTSFHGLNLLRAVWNDPIGATAIASHRLQDAFAQDTLFDLDRFRYAWVMVGWSLSLGPLLGGMTFLRVFTLEHPRIRPELPERLAPKGWRGWLTGIRGGGPILHAYLTQLLVRVHTDVIRAQLVLSSILERHMPAFAIGVPISLAIAIASLPFTATWISGFNRWFDLISLWLALTIAWTSPFLYCLFFIDETFEAAYAIQMRRCVARLANHVLILGYGDLGRRYVRELLQSGVVAYNTSYEHLAFSWNILLPNGNLAKVLSRIAAVEVEASQIDGVIRPPGHAAVGRVSMTRVVEHIAFPRRTVGDSMPSSPVEFVMPVIVGDAASEEIQNVAKLESADFVTCVIRPNVETDRTQAIFQRLDNLAERNVRVPAALALRSSTYPPYMAERIIANRLPVHYILPAQLEGLNAANQLHAFFRQKRVAGEPVQILICGRGKRLFYLIDSFLKAMTTSDYTHFEQTNDACPVLIVMTTDDDYVRTAEQLSPWTNLFQGWAERTAIVDRLELRALAVHRHVSRNPVVSQPGGPSTLRFSSEDNFVPLIVLDSRDHGNVFNVLNLIRPQAVLVSDHEADDEFRTINAIATNIARLMTETPKMAPPLVMVTGETGKSYLETNFQRAMTYYQSIHSDVVGSSASDAAAPTTTATSLYPDAVMSPATGEGVKLAGDPLIDVLEDPVERLVGLTAAYVTRRRGPIPVELNFCVPDSPGALASTLAGLSGCEVDASDQPVRASFTNSRFVAIRDEDFAIRSYMALTPEDDPQPWEDRGFARMAMTAAAANAKPHGTPRDPAGRLSTSVVSLALHRKNAPTAPTPLSSWLEQVAPDRTLTHVMHQARANGDPNVTKIYIDQASRCCGMPTCPVEVFNKIALPVMSNRALQRTPQVDSVIRRFLPHDWDNVPSPTLSDALAYVRVECMLLKRPGSFATALNALLHRRIVARHLSSEPANVFDFRYLSSYECHDDRFGVFTCYGRQVGKRSDMDKDQIGLCIGSVVKSVEIRPVTEEKRWQSYAKSLCAFMSTKADKYNGPRTHFELSPIEGSHGPRGWRISSEPRVGLFAARDTSVIWRFVNSTGRKLVVRAHWNAPSASHAATLRLEFRRLGDPPNTPALRSCVPSVTTNPPAGYFLRHGEYFDQEIDLGTIDLPAGRYQLTVIYDSSTANPFTGKPIAGRRPSVPAVGAERRPTSRELANSRYSQPWQGTRQIAMTVQVAVDRSVASVGLAAHVGLEPIPYEVLPLM